MFLPQSNLDSFVKVTRVPHVASSTPHTHEKLINHWKKSIDCCKLRGFWPFTWVREGRTYWLSFWLACRRSTWTCACFLWRLYSAWKLEFTGSEMLVRYKLPFLIYNCAQCMCHLLSILFIALSLFLTHHTWPIEFPPRHLRTFLSRCHPDRIRRDEAAQQRNASHACWHQDSKVPSAETDKKCETFVSFEEEWST